MPDPLRQSESDGSSSLKHGESEKATPSDELLTPSAILFNGMASFLGSLVSMTTSPTDSEFSEVRRCSALPHRRCSQMMTQPTYTICSIPAVLQRPPYIYISSHYAFDNCLWVCDVRIYCQARFSYDDTMSPLEPLLVVTSTAAR